MEHPPVRRRQIPCASKILLVAALLHTALCSLGSAALTGYDGFDYGTTGGDLTGKNGGTGWSGAYTDNATTPNSTVYTPTGLTYTGLPTIGGASTTADGGTATTINFRTTGPYSSGETWISFLARRNGAASTSTFAGISFYNSGGILAANSEFSIANGGASGTWRLLDTGANQSVPTGIAIASDTTYLLVARIRWGAGAGGTAAVSVFVNPTLGLAPVTAQASRDVAMTDFDKIRIAGARTAPDNVVDYTFDEIRIGDSYADVTPPLVPTSFPLTISPNGMNYDFNWPSKSGKTYDLLSSTDLSTPRANWAVYDPDGAGPNAALENMRTTAPNNLLSAVPANEPARFFAMREKDAAPGFAVTVDNLGVRGNTSTEGLSRFSDVLTADPDHLVIYFGINDALNSAKLVPLTTYRANLTSMVTQAINAGVRKVFLVSIHPVNAEYVASRHPNHPQLSRLQDHLTEYNAAVAKVATDTQVTFPTKVSFIDWRARFLEKSPGPTIAEATADVPACLLICAANTNPDVTDGVHLTIAGNNFLGVRVAQALSSVVVSGDKIVCFGDSITWGESMTGGGTDTGNTYPAVLKTTLNP